MKAKKELFASLSFQLHFASMNKNGFLYKFDMADSNNPRYINSFSYI